MRARLIAISILIALTAVFVAQNTEPVEVRLFVWTIAMSRALMFLAILGIGVLIGWGSHSYMVYRRRHARTDRRMGNHDGY